MRLFYPKNFYLINPDKKVEEESKLSNGKNVTKKMMNLFSKHDDNNSEDRDYFNQWTKPNESDV